MQVCAYEVTDWGVGTLYRHHGRLVDHELPTSRKPAGPIVDDDDLVAEIRRYLAGEPVTFETLDLDLDWCTPFQRAVVEALRGVRYGETVTYGELAALAGHPNAQRAAGTFCAHNRFPIFVPCHRVVAASGLGSYGELGTEYKARLLRLEGVDVLP